MNPQNRSYTLSGGRVTVGKLRSTGGGGGQPGEGGSVDLMTLIPEPGYLRSIHANALTDVAAPAGWQTESSGYNGPWSNWCGSVFASDYSQYGAEVYFGGGHGGYDGNEFYIFDLTSQLWSRLNNNPPTIWTQNTDATWCDYEYPPGSGNKMLPASHTYSHPVYITAAEGGGPKGSWCQPFIVYGGGPTEGAGISGFRPHSVDLDTGLWSRTTDNVTNASYSAGAYGGCIKDSLRSVIWGLCGTESSVVGRIDLNATPKHVTTQTITGGGGTIYAVPVYIPEIDKAVQVSVYEVDPRKITLAMYDMVAGVPTAWSTQPVFSTQKFTTYGAGIGVDYCPDTGKFYCYEGRGSSLVHVATPPAGGVANWKTGTWTWSSETMQGETPVSVLEPQPGALGPQVLTKWKYYRDINCFGFSGGGAIRPSPDGVARAGAFQIFRPLGT